MSDEKKMLVVYIAGPFRAANAWEIEKNIRRAEELSLQVWLSNPRMAAICPHTNNRFFSGIEPVQIWLEGDLEILRRCDALLTTDDWMNSQGARAEVLEAVSLRIPVFHSIVDLQRHNILVNREAELP